MPLPGDAVHQSPGSSATVSSHCKHDEADTLVMHRVGRTEACQR